MKVPNSLVLASLFSLGAALPHVAEPKRWAVIVGVGDYEHFGDEIGGDLPGSVNDARNVREVLQSRWGFRPDHVRMLLDRDATRAGIRAELAERLPSVVGPSDLVVFYFAGHGSQAWDLNGDEEDGLDETLAPYDAQRGSTEADITDDELGEWLRALPTRNVTVILDNCHAGTGTRAVTPFARPRTLNRSISDVPRPAGTRSVSAPSPPPELLEIAAAQADQVAVDVAWPEKGRTSPTWGGAFTTILVRYLWEVPAGTSYEEVFRLTQQELKQQGFAQDPRLAPGAGRQRSPAFGLPGTVRAAPFAVAATSGATTVELSGGSALGLTEGSLLRAGASTLRVTQVGQDRIRAEVLGGGSVQVGTPAEITAFRYPEARLRVLVADVPEPGRATLTQGLRSPGVEFTLTPDVVADLIVRPQGQSYQVLGLDGATRHVVPASTPAAGAAALAPILQQELGARRLAALENPAHPFPVNFAFARGKQAFRIGEPVGFRVRSGRDGYLTIVDLGTDGTVTVLFPNDMAPDNRVRAGQEIVLPPPAKADEFVATEPAGRGVVRAFVTERPLQVPTSGGVVQPDAVVQALRAAAGAPAAAPGSEAIALGNWATASMVYSVTW